MFLTTLWTDVSAVLEKLESMGIWKFVSAAVLLVVCLIAKKAVMKVLSKTLEHSKLEKSAHTIIRSVASILLLFVIVLVVAGSLGVDTTSLLAVFSVAGLAASLALQDSLSNLASGVVILLSKPFKSGDYVTAGGVSGTVAEIGITHTKLNTVDNQVLLIPNSVVTSNIITNVSTEETRRVDLKFSASYDSSTEAVLEALKEAVDLPQVLQDQPVFIRLTGYGEHAMEYTVRVWVRNADYWDVYFAILDRVKPAFDTRGVKMTYPHLLVHAAEPIRQSTQE